MIKYLKLQGLMEDTIDNETVLLDSNNKKIYFINETAYFIWKNCNDIGLQEICEKLMDALDEDSKNTVTMEMIKEDVMEAIIQLIDLKLISENKG